MRETRTYKRSLHFKTSPKNPSHSNMTYKCPQEKGSGELQDGGRVRCGDHFPPHKYIRNTSTCGTTPTEHMLNAGRRHQTSQKARNSPRTWVGQKKREKTETKE